ncbi:MAG: tetratricopeptide repeat protein [Nisaea sp.]|uniref:tetratricopeptide repeat protein n=1 Tax=Nisaea sp. TaxID=2024842 RepID=UPI001B292C22|nr:tetratricopeptide repeat protein [Nisaea sp.]MBO6559994.1 tetratricopeptide repeat protein [Nisaea sp.]
MTDNPYNREPESEEAGFFRELLQASLEAHRKNQFDRAESGYREILSRYPDHAATRDLYGTLLYQTNRLEAAAANLERAVGLDPGQAPAWNHLGAVRLAQGRPSDALDAFRKATDADPQNPEAWLNRSRLAEMRGDIADAVLAARTAVERLPNYPVTLARLGAALLAAGRFEEAIAPLEAASVRAPDNVEPYLHLAICLKQAAQGQRSQAALRKALLLAPERAVLYPHLSGEPAGEHSSVDLVSWARRAVCLAPRDGGLWAALAAACEAKKLDASAVTAAKRSLLLVPDGHAAHHCLALPLFRLERFAEAAKTSRHALLLYPDIAELYFVAAACAFIFGDPETGWRYYEARAGSRIDSARVGLPPTWDWKSVPDRLLVAAEQGVGDEYIFFSRLGCLQGRAREITVECDPRNRRLFQRSFPDFRFIDRQLKGREGREAYFDYGTAVAELGFDNAILAGSLLARFVQDARLLGPLSYLVPDADDVETWRRYFRARTSLPLIGLCWRGGASSIARDRLYCDAITMVEGLGPQRGYYVNLVYSLRDGELEQVRNRLGCDIHDPTGIDQKNELDRLAAMLSVLDAVVSVDTAVCPLAAAVGTPTLRLGRGLLYLSDGYDAVLGSCHPMSPRAEPFDMRFCLDRSAQKLREILISPN